MAILANFLAVAFSGLFYEGIENIASAAHFSSSLELPLNSELLQRKLEISSTDHIHVTKSTFTAKTPIPAYIDDKFFYLPFDSTSNTNTTWQRRATTRALGAQLDCVPLLPGGLDSIGVRLGPSGDYGRINATISGNGTKPSCSKSEGFDLDISRDIDPMLGLAAVEVMFPACGEYLIAGWLRGNVSNRPDGTTYSFQTHYNVKMNLSRMTFLACYPRLRAGISDVIIDSAGVVQHASLLNEFDRPPESWFAGNSSLMFSKLLVTTIEQPLFTFTWHTDSSSSNEYHGLISMARTDSSRFVDPSLPTPSAKEAAAVFSEVYAKLFAILLGSNLDLILPSNNTQTTLIPGLIVKPTTRIFLSLPMFILAEFILGLYILVTILVYVRRPSRFLPRLPTSLASIIPFLVASQAELDLKGTSGMSTKERDDYVRKLDHRYGFGKFVGTNGKPMIGIERDPYVVLLRKEDLE